VVLPFLKIALVLVRLDQIACRMVNVKHGIMWAAAMLSVSDCIRDGIGIAIPQPTEWERIGNQINAAFMFAGSDFVNAK
jgi:hypothetical protein